MMKHGMRRFWVGAMFAVALTGCGAEDGFRPWDFDRDGLVEACEGLNAVACANRSFCIVTAPECQGDQSRLSVVALKHCLVTFACEPSSMPPRVDGGEFDAGASCEALSYDACLERVDCALDERRRGEAACEPEGRFCADAGLPSCVTLVRDAGSWTYDAGSPVRDAGSWTYDAGSPVRDAGSWTYDAGSPVRDAGSWTYDAGSPVRDAGSRTSDAGIIVRRTGS